MKFPNKDDILETLFSVACILVVAACLVVLGYALQGVW